MSTSVKSPIKKILPVIVILVSLISLSTTVFATQTIEKGSYEGDKIQEVIDS